MKTNRGIAPLVIIIAIVVIAALGYGGYRVATKPKPAETNVNTKANTSVGVFTSLRTAYDSGKPVECMVTATVGGQSFVGYRYFMKDGYLKIEQLAQGNNIVSYQLFTKDKYYIWNNFTGKSAGAPVGIYKPLLDANLKIETVSDSLSLSCVEKSIPDSVFLPPQS